MSMEGSSVQIEIIPQRVQRFSASKQELYGADIAIPRTVPNQRNSSLVLLGGGTTRGQKLEHKVCATIPDLAGESLERRIILHAFPCRRPIHHHSAVPR